MLERMLDDKRRRAVEEPVQRGLDPFTAYDDEILPSAVPDGRHRPGDPARGDVEAREIGLARSGSRWRSCSVTSRVTVRSLMAQEREALGMLAEVAAEPGLVHLLAAVAVIADQDADLARDRADAVKGLGRRAPDLPVVEADIAHAQGRGQGGD